MLKTNQFFFDKDSKELSQEASSLGWPALKAPLMFTLESSHTGRKVTMELVKVHHEYEGDITHWEYRSNLVPVTVLVWND